MANQTKCPRCLARLNASEIKALWGGFMQSQRTNRVVPTRQKDMTVERCLCGANTLKRATAQAFMCCKRAGLMERSKPGRKARLQ